MKKKRFSILLISFFMLGMLLSLTACGNKDNENDIDNSPKKSTSTGMNSPEELIKSFYDDVKDSQVSKAKKYFNAEAMVACEILKDWDLDFYEVYELMFNLDKSIDYLREQYPNFAKAVENENMKFDETTINRLQEMLDKVNEDNEEVIDFLIGYPESKIDKIEKEENYSRIDINNLQIYEVTINYSAEESSQETLDIWVIEIDNEYYIATVD